MGSRKRILMGVLATLALLLAACGGAPDGGDDPEASAAVEGLLQQIEMQDERIGGEIEIAGSSTVFPLTEAVAEAFKDEGFGGEITIASIGSGAGFERFCVTAETDISNASRPIKEAEQAACAANGREALEFRVGTDALAITVSRDNDFLSDLTMEQLAAIVSGDVATWADVNPAWPKAAIQLYSPGTDSGTFDYFVEAVFDREAERILTAEKVQYSEDDNVLVTGISGSPFAIGYFGYAYYLENEEQVRVLSVNGITPTAETAESNEYPLSRPLYIYSATSILKQKPQVAAFVEFYVERVNDLITEVGYFPASAESLLDARRLLLDALR